MGKKGSKFYYSASPQQIIQQFYSLNSFCSFSTTSVVAALFLELQTWTLRDFMTYMLAIQFQLSSSLSLQLLVSLKPRIYLAILWKWLLKKVCDLQEKGHTFKNAYELKKMDFSLEKLLVFLDFSSAISLHTKLKKNIH